MQKLNWKQSIFESFEYLNHFQAFYSSHGAVSVWILLIAPMIPLHTAIWSFESRLRANLSLKSLTIQQVGTPRPALFFSWLMAWNSWRSQDEKAAVLLRELVGRCTGSGWGGLSFFHSSPRGLDLRLKACWLHTSVLDISEQCLHDLRFSFLVWFALFFPPRLSLYSK